MSKEVHITLKGEDCTEVREQFNEQKCIYTGRIRRKATSRDFLKNLLELDREVNNIE